MSANKPERNLELVCDEQRTVVGLTSLPYRTLLYVNLFTDGTALLEDRPQGDASLPLDLPAEQLAQLEALLDGPEASGTLASLFLAGVRIGERQARVGTGIGSGEVKQADTMSA